MKLIVFCGASGAGKSKIQHDIEDIVPFVTNYTTRPLRDDEVDGKHIKHVTIGEFIDLVKHNKLLEYSYYGNYLYGTPKWVEDTNTWYQTTKAKNGIEALLNIIDKKENIFIVHVYADPVTRVLRMLEQKRTYDEIKYRLALDTQEVLDFYDSVADLRVVNNSDNLDDYITLLQSLRDTLKSIVKR